MHRSGFDTCFQTRKINICCSSCNDSQVYIDKTDELEHTNWSKLDDDFGKCVCCMMCVEGSSWTFINSNSRKFIAIVDAFRKFDIFTFVGRHIYWPWPMAMPSYMCCYRFELYHNFSFIFVCERAHILPLAALFKWHVLFALVSAFSWFPSDLGRFFFCSAYNLQADNEWWKCIQ